MPRHKRKVAAKRKPKSRKPKTMTVPIELPGTFWKTFFTAHGDLIGKGEFLIERGRLKGMDMDPANVAMLAWGIKLGRTIPKTRFGLPTREIAKQLRAYTAKELKDPLSLRLDFIAKEYHITIGQSFFSGNTIEPPKKTNIPNLEPWAYFSMATEKFQSIIKRAGNVGESIRLSIPRSKIPVTQRTGPQVLSFFAEGEDDAEGKPKAFHEDVNVWPGYGGSEAGVISSKYSLEYLKKFLKFVSILGEEIRIEFRTDYPLSIISDSPKYGLSIRFILAPRVDND